MQAREIIPLLNEHLGFELTLIEDIQAHFDDPDRYPDSYREVMTIEEEMVGSMYSKHAFSDKDGRLVGLNLFGCDLISSQVDKVMDLPLGALKSLNLAKNELTHLTISAQFTALVFLNASENPGLQLLGIDPACSQLARLELFECDLARISFPASLHKLYYADLSGNNNLQQCDFEGGLDGLQLIFLRGTSIEQIELPGHFPKLVHLYLNENKQLAEVEIENPLPKLSTLQLRNCALENFSEEYIKLGEEEVQETDFWRKFLAYFPAIDSVFFSGNPVKDSTLITKLVDEDGQNNLRTIRNYYLQREEGLQRDNENKVLLIGNGKAGKTNILRRFIKEKFNEKWDSTHGITIKKFPLKKFDLYFWDFGGQDIYHNTHRLFMQQDAVYILAWRVETEEDERTEHTIKQPNGTFVTRSYRNYKLDYWLNYARQLGKGSPMIVTQTNIHEDGIQKPPVQEVEIKFKEYFSEGFRVCHVESNGKLDAYNSYQSLENALLKSVKTIKEKQPKISSALFNLRAYLRDLQTLEKGPKRLALETYREEAKKLGVLDPDLELKTWLFRTGVVYFKEGVFNNDIILDQTWVINAIYALFDRKDERMDEIRDQGGEFNGAKLREIWADEYPDPEVQELLLGFMLDCDICYEVESREQYPGFEQRRFVAPKLLRDQEPPGWEDYQQNEVAHKESPVYVKYAYPFLHEKLMESIIARTAYLADKPWLLWQGGTRIARDGQVLFAERRKNSMYVSFPKASFPLFQDVQKLIEELQDETPSIFVSSDGYSFDELSGKQDKEDTLWRSIIGGATKTLEGEEYRGDAVPISPETGAKAVGFEKNIPQPIRQAPLSEVESLISKDQLIEAAQMLLHGADEQSRQRLVLALNQLRRMESDRSDGIVSAERYDINRNQAAKNLLSILHNKPSEEGQSPLAEMEVVTSKVENEDSDTPIFSIEQQTDTITIQILAASPEDKSRMRTGQEYRRLKEAFLTGSNREAFKFFEKEEAVNLPVLQRAFRRKPHILHFSGHGGKEGIFLMNSLEKAVAFTDEDIKTMFKRLRGSTKLVILNACHSSRQAKIISTFNMYVIGTRTKILDRASVFFSESFYRSLSDGASYEEAYQDAKMVVGHDFPSEKEIFEAWFDGQLLNW